MWYWEGGFHLLHDTIVCMEFCCWCVSVFTCVIPLPVYVCVYMCVFNQKIKKMMLSVVKSSHNSKVWYLEEIISCFATLTAVCSFCVGVWVYSLFSSPFLYTYMCLLVFIKKKEKREILNVVKLFHISSVWYLEGVYHLLHDNNYCIQFWFCLVSVFYCFIAHPLYNLCVCVCLCLTKEKKQKKR